MADIPFRLDSQQVGETWDACVSEDGDEYDLIQGTVRLDKDKVAQYGELIFAMLMELPEQFRESGGGGWSFLNACNDRHGNQWTGFHLRMAQLFVLGEAAGLVDCPMPREMWSALPGGMPYYLIKDKNNATLAKPDDREGTGA